MALVNDINRVIARNFAAVPQIATSFFQQGLFAGNENLISGLFVPARVQIGIDLPGQAGMGLVNAERIHEVLTTKLSGSEHFL